MRCAHCNSEFHSDSGVCPVCGTPNYTQNAMHPTGGYTVEVNNRDELSFGTPPPRKNRAWIGVVTAVAVVAVLLVCGFFLIHFGTEATCMEDSECKICGKILEEATGHDWEDATCTDPKTCKDCGKTKGSAAGHDWKSATCTDPKTCETCGKTEGSVADHDWKDATCTDPMTCATCGKTSGSAAGHSWKAATQQAPKTCKVCGITEGDLARTEEAYLAEMDYNDKYGKLWIRSEKEMFRTYHADAKDLDVWKDYSRPGNTVGAVYDIWGNRYQYGLHIDGYDSKDYYVSYYLGGNYTRFTAWCAFPMDPLSKNSVRSDKYVEIWADGEFLYATPVMGHKSPREYIDLNITGVRVLTIRYPATVNNNEAATLYDAKVS